ncbi:MAG: hypothetical protein K5793_04260 [Nitrosarchaeum sp.]|nr:hypothetical protein [Nitrosarchaeum sp.]
MGELFDLDITGLIKKKSGAPLGDAHELFVRAIMMRLGLEAGKADLSSSAYDVVIVGMEKIDGKKLFLRVQVKTIDNSLNLTGGSRGGVDREYISKEKVYKYSTDHSDLIFGVDRDKLDIYVVPTLFVDLWGSSVAKSKIQILKNNWEILVNWNTGYLFRLKEHLKPVSK